MRNRYRAHPHLTSPPLPPPPPLTNLLPPLNHPKPSQRHVLPIGGPTNPPVVRCARKLARFSNWSANRAPPCGSAMARRLATLTGWSGWVMLTGRTRRTSAPACHTTSSTHALDGGWDTRPRAFASAECFGFMGMPWAVLVG